MYADSTYSLNSITVFPPVVDNIVFSEPIEKLVAKNQFKKCKIITGFNTNEMAFFIAVYDLLGPNPLTWESNAKSMNNSTFVQLISEIFHFYPYYTHRNFTQTLFSNLLSRYMPHSASYFKRFESMWTDFMYSCQSFELAKIYSKQNLDAYFYQYNFRISTGILPEYFGVVHIDDDPIVFAETLANKVLFSPIYILFYLNFNYFKIFLVA
jgi:carboxylesterase type B